MRALSPVCDYFVIASGTSKRQMHTVADDLAEMGDERGNQPLHISGEDSEQWVLVDFFHVVVHLFNDEARRFYDLENLWGDATRVEWERKA
jgi:ribosome-associated protein